jgi:hypothetical protein
LVTHIPSQLCYRYSNWLLPLLHCHQKLPLPPSFLQLLLPLLHCHQKLPLPLLHRRGAYVSSYALMHLVDRLLPP